MTAFCFVVAFIFFRVCYLKGGEQLFFLLIVVVVFVTQVTYDPKVQARTVTLGGDLFDPQGTATGGK